MKMVTIMTNSQTRHYKSRHADDRQKELHKKFPDGHFLNDERNLDHVFLWNTFFRRNLHRVATDYLGITLHIYQVILLYVMGICQLIVVIASRAAAKSFIIALYACCRCIVYPYSKIVLASGTKGQAKLIVSEKIQNELMAISPMLRREIRTIKNNQNEVIVYFRNHSTITVVAALDSSRGYRSNCCIREEYRQIDKGIEDSVLSPFQTVRQPPYRTDPYYSEVDELKEEPVNIYISSSWLDNGHWMWDIADQSFAGMMAEKDSCLLAFDESITLKHNIRTMKQLQAEKKKQDPLTWRIEFLNERVKENTSAFFSYNLLRQNQVLKQPWYPRLNEDVRSGRKNPYDIAKQPGEVRIVSCDMAFVEGQKNDNSIFTCGRLLPETNRNNVAQYKANICYIDSIQGGDTAKQALSIRRLYADWSADYLVLDFMNGGAAIYDMLARPLFDEDRGIEYPALCCMNNDDIAARVKTPGANPCIYAMRANQNLNSDIAIVFRRMLAENRVSLLVPFQEAEEELLPKIKEYVSAPDADTMFFYERPYLETQALISETTSLVYEKKAQTGAIVIREQGTNRKDRYTSCSYLCYVADLLQQDLLSQNEEYEFMTIIN